MTRSTEPAVSRRRDSRHPSRRVLAALAVVGILAAGWSTAGAVGAEPPTTDPTTAAGYGARWLATRFDPAGFVPGPTDDPDVSATLQSTLALAAAGVEGDTFDQAVTWLRANVATVIDGGVSGDDPARVGLLLLIADAADVDPTDFGGLNLPQVLLATQGTFAPGLFGAADPSFDGAYRQGIAISGLVASGTAVPASATDWLVDQQCDDTTPEAAGGWMPYRADLNVPCVAPDKDTFAGPDTNGTAMALQALRSLGPFAGTAAALDFLDAAQGAGGGFPYIPGGDVDPNSTALVVLAILAGGEDPSAGRWVEGAATPVTSLLSWQVGCDADPADRGAFASPFTDGLPDAIATPQAVWGAAERTFPLGEVTFAAAPVPCPPATTTTTTTAPSTTTTAPGATTTTTTPSSPAAVAVVAQPHLAG